MKEKRNHHLKIQELCDCYATTDPLSEMARIKDESDSETAALKWLALSALHGINAGVDKISIHLTKDGQVEVTASYRTATLPSPGKAVGAKIFEAVREITHIEAEKGKMPLALGIRDSSIDLGIKIKSEDGHDKLSISFPE
ncbi:MAG: hypothetical protein RBT11_07260 [Desulfobacterales bacterium]|jgi:hypothetical protein|nr:hypothetical protein [Desulfobacterales bacterium]